MSALRSSYLALASPSFERERVTSDSSLPGLFCNHFSSRRGAPAVLGGVSGDTVLLVLSLMHRVTLGKFLSELLNLKNEDISLLQSLQTLRVSEFVSDIISQLFTVQ